MTPIPRSFRFLALGVALPLYALATPPGYAASDLSVGTAKGSLTSDDATAALSFAAAFVDQKDERKPVILVLSDKKLPVEKWTSEFDMMLSGTKFNGIVFFLDKEGKVFRTDVHMKDRQIGVAGIFEVKMEKTPSKDPTGTATAAAGPRDKLQDAF